MDKKDISLFRYRGCIPEILRYQIITKSCLAVMAFLLRYARGAVLWTTSRSAVTSGDLPFLMTTIQGWIVIALAILMLILYMVIDINAMIILSSRVLHQKPVKIRPILTEAVQSLKLFRDGTGVFLLLFVSFLIPLAGIGLGISLTEKFYIPDFITSVINSNVIYSVLYHAGLLLVYVLSICYLFSFHYIIIGKKTARQARKSAYQTMKSSWKNFARRYLLFLLKSLLIGAVIILGTFVLLFGTAVMMERYTPVSFRFVITFITILLLGIADLYMMLFTPFQVMELTRIYESYTEEDEGEILFPKKRKHPFMIAVVAAFILFDVGISFLSDREFDTMFPKVDQTEIIVHRAGGTLGNENTVYGLEQAIAVGAMASEIDVQRTKDGYYILNHDHTFQRLAGDSRTSEEMTLSEIKQLRVPAYNSLLGEEQEFATLDEILDAAEGRIHLYIEMKGATADEQMAEDLYRRVSERKMLDEVTFISLSYPMISYMETEHPDAVTGYLCYASLGELAELPADELILEEEIATPENIEKIHQAGKRVSVWTVNQAVSRVRFFARNADAIITDEAEDSMEFRKLLRDLCGSDPGVQLFDEETADLIRVLFRVLFVWWP